MNLEQLKKLLADGDPAFWDGLYQETAETLDFDTLFRLSVLRQKAKVRGLARPGKVREKFRMAIVGGYNFYPFTTLLEHCAEMEGMPLELWVGEFDNYVSEIMEPESKLYQFQPQAVLIVPSASRAAYNGPLTDSRESQAAAGLQLVDQIMGLAQMVHKRTGAEVFSTNFVLPPRHDPGSYRARSLGSDWSFRKFVNLELGLQAPPFLHICDLEFLSYRHGGLLAQDERGWHETKQPGSPLLLVLLAREVTHLLGAMHRPPKKVLVLDLDNTLWGGVLADDGLEGIEIGDTSPAGEAFKDFQQYIKQLQQRGVLLAVASKNDAERVLEAFERHPEMCLRRDDFVAFRANWEPKSDNLRSMAAELNLGLESFVFVDDNPAEIEIARQFTPEVATVLLGPDPSGYVSQLQDGRFFETRQLTTEDQQRTAQYRAESQREALRGAAADMPAYLESLEMEGEVRHFNRLDVPRLSQLINKSNQFNLTTRRRTEAELLVLMDDPAYLGFSFRLKDRFGDHGLISIVIAHQVDTVLEIDTWLMSCRVLKRQVEDEVFNELLRIAESRHCSKLKGVYLPTAKNSMVRDFYDRMGFSVLATTEQSSQYEFPVTPGAFRPTKIRVTSPTLPV